MPNMWFEVPPNPNNNNSRPSMSADKKKRKLADQADGKRVGGGGLSSRLEKEADAAVAKRVKLDYQDLSELIGYIDPTLAEPWESWNEIVRAIAAVSRNNNLDGFSIAVDFSKKSIKYKSEEDVRKMYESLPGNNVVDWYTLKKYACRTTAWSSGLLDVFREKIDPSVESITEVDSVSSSKSFKISCLMNNGTTSSYRLYTQYGDIRRDGESRRFLAFLRSKLTVVDRLSDVNPSFRNPDNAYAVDMTEESFFFTDSNDSRAGFIDLRKPFLSKDSSLVICNGHSASRTKRGKLEISRLRETVAKASLEAIVSFGVNTNIIKIQDLIRADDRFFIEQRETLRSQAELIQALLDEEPHLINTYKYFDSAEPDQKYFEGLYSHKKVDNNYLWKKRSKSYIQNILYKKLKRICQNEDELYHIGMDSHMTALQNRFCYAMYDESLIDKMDNNMDGIALQNGLWDSTTINEIRPIRKSDFIMTTAGWRYSKTESEEYMPELTDLLNRIFPDANIQKIVFTYVSALLQGRRLDRHFLIMTDRRGGSNGKSTFFKLLKTIFGPFYFGRSKYALKASFEENKNSHDGGLVALRHKRVMVCDELTSNSSLDRSFLKEVTGGSCELGGRNMNSEHQYTFPCETGIILCFNEKDCPKFETWDQALLARIVVIPMVSKFDPKATWDDPSTYTYRCEPKINTAEYMLKLASSFFDVLRQHFSAEGLMGTEIPRNMNQWKAEITLGNNQLAEWLDENVMITGRREDYVTVRILYEQYVLWRRMENKRLGIKDFRVMVQGYCVCKGLVIKDDHYVRTIDKVKHFSSIITGARLKN